MVAGAQLSITDLRRAARHPVDHPVIGEHRQIGDTAMQIVNISSHGFMVNSRHGLTRGERITIRLPVIGRVEAHMIWGVDERSGFQFERIIRVDDFLALIDALKPNPRPRRRWLKSRWC